MANKTKKLFVLGTLVAGMFMAISACDISHFVNPNNPSNQNSEESSSIKIPDGAVLNNILVINNKDAYERGEELDLTVTANYSGDFSIQVSNYQVEGFNNRQTGTQTITVTYEDKSFSLDVFVREPVFVGISASSNKQNYEFGEELSLTVVANYSDGSSEEIENYQVNGYNAQNPGEQNLVISYQGQSCSLKVTVNDPILVGLTLTGNKQSYEYGEQLDIVVTATYSDGSQSVITNYEVEGFDNKNPGEQTITVKYAGKSTSFSAVVNNPALTGISVTGNKQSYEYGEDLDIVVTANYSDDSTTNINNYEVEGFNNKQPGEQTVTIKYEDKSYSFKVTVNNPALVGITAVSNKATYDYGDELDVTVEATYSDGSKVTITDYQVSGFNSKEGGEQTLTFTYEDKSCTLKVGVNDKYNRFPADKFNSFLSSEGIKSSIPAPVGYYSWSNSVEKEQDGSNYFYTTTKDEGTVGVDSLADQYALLLSSNNWEVENKDGTYTATKKDGDVVLTFSSKNGTFALRAESYSEFPTKKFVANLIKSKASIGNGDKILIASITEEIIVSGYENGAFKTSECPTGEKGIQTVAKNAWRFTINKSGNYFTLTDINGRKLGATGLGELAWNKGSTEWSILITTDSALIMNTNTEYGRLCFNTLDGNITTYSKGANDTHLVYPQIFKVTEEDIVYPESISLDGKKSISVGNTAKLSVSYYPENANTLSKVSWSSSDENVATVESGVVTAVSVGTTTITASCLSKNTTLSTTYNVTVTENGIDSWTILVYMCGSNLESEGGYASSDIAEVLKVSNQPDDVNVVFETGGTTRWRRYNISASVLSRYHVEDKSLVLDETVAKANMGLRSTFESFLSWGLENYPAEKVGVIFWNHGGALGGVCYDDSVGRSDSLTNSETKQAFQNVLGANNIDKLEFVGYDACLMQVQDIAEFNSHYFNYMVTSEETEAGSGWVYDQWIDDVYAGKDTKTILKANCDSFVNRNGSDQTLSYLDLSKMANYFNKFETMAAAIKSTAKGNYSSFKSIINSTKKFTEFSYYGLIDGLDFLNNLANDSTYESFADKIADAKAAYGELVAYSRRGGAAGNSNGLAIVAATSCSYPSSETSFTNWRSIFK